MKIKDKRLIWAVAVTLIAMCVIAVVGIVSSSRRQVVLQGYVECEQITISGKLTGRVESLRVREGDSVLPGDTLVVINCPEAYAKLRQASGVEQAAEFQRRKIDDGARRQEVETVLQLWRKSQAELELATATHSRVEALWRDSIVTAQRRDEVRTLLAAARANEHAAHQQYEMVRIGARRQDIESAQSMVDAARGAVEEVEAMLRDIALTSPVAGQVADVYPRVGELVGAGSPLMNLVVLSDAHVVLNVREDYLPHFAMGSVFVGDVPALAVEDIPFRVCYVSPLGSYATWRSARQAGSYDLRTFEIHARPEVTYLGRMESLGLRPGMSVIVRI